MPDDPNAALDVVNDLYQLFVPLARSAVMASQHGRVSTLEAELCPTLEGLTVGLKAMQVARQVIELVEATDPGQLPAVLVLLEQSLVVPA